MPEQEQVLETPETAPVEQVETAAVSEAAQSESEEPKQGGVQRRIDKLTRERYELSGQNRELRERLAALERQQQAKPVAEQVRAEAEDPKPDPKTWTGTYEELTEALSRWAARQEHKALTEKRQREESEREQQERSQEVVEYYQEASTAFRAEHEDFNEVVGRIKMAQDVAMPVQNAIMEDENGPQLAYFLGHHPEVCDQLSELSPTKALVMLGRISAQLFPEEAEEDSPETVTKPAPAPLRPVKKSSPTSTGLSDDLPMDEWLARRRKQLAASGRKL